MITKERLEELIKEGATIWCPYWCYEEGIELDDKDSIAENKLIVKYEVYKDHYNTIPLKLEYLFETKEEAKFASRYQDITRTEILSLPTWKEFIKMEKPRFDFIAIKDEIPFIYVCEADFGYRQRKPIGLCVLFKEYGEKGYDIIFQTEVCNKKNYLKACEICRKLFLGENL